MLERHVKVKKPVVIIEKIDKSNNLSKTNSKGNVINSSTQPDRIGKFLEDVLKFLANIAMKTYKHTCCGSMSPSRNFSTKRKSEINHTIINKSNSHNSHIIAPSATSFEEEYFSPIAFDSVDIPESPVLDSKFGLKVTTKLKLKNFLKKLKLGQQDDLKNANNKCCGKCIPISTDSTVLTSTYNSSSLESMPDVCGDGVQRIHNRQRIAGFFNDIYNGGVILIRRQRNPGSTI